jgi:hypothetical protein
LSPSLHHHHCDHFRKIQQENAKWTGALILYVVLYCVFALLGPSKGV